MIYIGDTCFLNPAFPMPIDLGAGILLTDQKDVIVNCFGFNETNVTSSCFRWRREEGVWKPPKEVIMEEHIKLQLDSILNNSIQHFLFPTHTFCKVIEHVVEDHVFLVPSDSALVTTLSEFLLKNLNQALMYIDNR